MCHDREKWFLVTSCVPEPEGGVVGTREEMMWIRGTPFYTHHPPSMRGERCQDHTALWRRVQREGGRTRNRDKREDEEAERGGEIMTDVLLGTK